MIDPDTQIPVTLTAAQWNTVLYIMNEAPVPRRITHPLFEDIQRQCMETPQSPDLHLVDNLAG